jgi:hypothetical protein
MGEPDEFPVTSCFYNLTSFMYSTFMESGPNEKPSHYHAYMTDAKRWRKTLKDYSRANRSKATEAENVLWQLVRNNQLGPHFRRQHAID